MTDAARELGSLDPIAERHAGRLFAVLACCAREAMVWSNIVRNAILSGTGR